MHFLSYQQYLTQLNSLACTLLGVFFAQNDETQTERVGRCGVTPAHWTLNTKDTQRLRPPVCPKLDNTYKGFISMQWVIR